ncbi:MAG TPA: hypothetical protein VFO31_12890 [Vicinamibacterales bacterium]|nr:hypothetical protein [Vicinamibacterales bacterium]
MNLSTLRRVATQVLLVAVALAAVLTSGAPAQSLGDVARKEEARRKETGRGKTYTNENLRSAPEPAAPAPSPSASTPSSSAPSSAAAGTTKPSTTPDAKSGDAAKAGDAPKADAKPAPDAKGDAATWKKRRETIETALERAKTFAEALQSRINGLTADFSARDDPAQRSLVAADRQKALTEMERVKKEIAEHTKALADLQEEARKSGVPPGWLR